LLKAYRTPSYHFLRFGHWRRVVSSCATERNA